MSWPVGVDLLRQVMQQILTNNVQIYLLFPHRTMRLSLTKLTYRKPASLVKQFGRWEISCWSVSLRLHKSRKIDPLSMCLHCSQPDANSTLISTRTECFLSFFYTGSINGQHSFRVRVRSAGRDYYYQSHNNWKEGNSPGIGDAVITSPPQWALFWQMRSCLGARHKVRSRQSRKKVAIWPRKGNFWKQR